MSPPNLTHISTQAVDELSESESYKGLFHQHKNGEPLPSTKVLYEIIELSRSILFPGYCGNSTVNSWTINYHIDVNIRKLFDSFCEQILVGLHLNTSIEGKCSVRSDSKRGEAVRPVAKFISKLSAVRKMLAADMGAAYNGSPTTENYGEVTFCYPAIKTISSYRVAHELLELGVPLIPRITTEMTHSETGIDVHPTAKIGTHFTIDHSTGVVVGATNIIEGDVKLYQGVTLGAKSFSLDADKKPIKGVPRHPILEDNIIAYSSTAILGRITTGRDTTISGNTWVTGSAPAGARTIQAKAKK